MLLFIPDVMISVALLVIAERNGALGMSKFERMNSEVRLRCRRFEEEEKIK